MIGPTFLAKCCEKGKIFLLPYKFKNVPNFWLGQFFELGSKTHNTPVGMAFFFLQKHFLQNDATRITIIRHDLLLCRFNSGTIKWCIFSTIKKGLTFSNIYQNVIKVYKSETMCFSCHILEKSYTKFSTVNLNSGFAFVMRWWKQKYAFRFIYIYWIKKGTYIVCNTWTIYKQAWRFSSITSLSQIFQ